jgi:hypothetical protein
MKMHRHQAAAALAIAMVIASGVSAGCTPTLESAQSSAARPPTESTGRAIVEAGDGILELTQRVDWVRVEAAPLIQGF